MFLNILNDLELFLGALLYLSIILCHADYVQVLLAEWFHLLRQLWNEIRFLHDCWCRPHA